MKNVKFLSLIGAIGLIILPIRVKALEIYYAADKPPTDNIPAEAPLCYKFQVASLEEQLGKIKIKYTNLYDEKIIKNNDGSRSLLAKRKTESSEEIQYFYSDSPSICNEYQKKRITTEDLQQISATGVSLLKRMIQLAAEDGGIRHIQELHDLKQRIEALPKPTPKDKQTARVLFVNGRAAYDSGLLEIAAQYYADARKFDPADIKIIAHLGFIYVKLGKLEAALEPLTTAATLAPGRSGRWASLAEYYARNGQPQEAVACYALAVHFSRNPAKAVEFINKLAQDPEPKVQQAAQQTLQLRLVQSVTAPEKATLETPLADVSPVAVSQVEPQRPSQPVQPSPPPVTAPVTPAKTPEESLQANALPPNPATVLDQPVPSEPSPTPTLEPSSGTSLNQRTDISSGPNVGSSNTFPGDGRVFLSVPKSNNQTEKEIKDLSTKPKTPSKYNATVIDRQYGGFVLGSSIDEVKNNSHERILCSLDKDNTTRCSGKNNAFSFKNNSLIFFLLSLDGGLSKFIEIDRENTKKYGSPKIREFETTLPGTPLISKIKQHEWSDESTKFTLSHHSGVNIKGEIIDSTAIMLNGIQTIIK